MITCKICNIDVRSIRSLSKHIRDKHQCQSKDYYDKFIQIGPAQCVVCQSSDVTFKNLSLGYSQTCSHKCACTHHRKTLANDAERDSAFRAKVSANQTKIWENRQDTDESAKIRAKISDTIKQINAQLTDDELTEKYGWLNKLSEEEKKQAVQILLRAGAHAWWKNATDEEKLTVYNKRNATKLGIPLTDYKRTTPDDKELYNRLVYMHTEATYSKYKTLLDPHDRRGKGYHLDHKFSRAMGFQNNIPPEIIGSVINLEIIPDIENMSKGAKCSITESMLMERYYGTI